MRPFSIARILLAAFALFALAPAYVQTQLHLFVSLVFEFNMYNLALR